MVQDCHVPRLRLAPHDWFCNRLAVRSWFLFQLAVRVTRVVAQNGDAALPPIPWAQHDFAQPVFFECGLPSIMSAD
jgi:hypothetical protein